jgi:hypothetical protein
MSSSQGLAVIHPLGDALTIYLTAGEETLTPAFGIYDYGTVNLGFAFGGDTNVAFHFSADGEAWTTEDGVVYPAGADAITRKARARYCRIRFLSTADVSCTFHVRLMQPYMGDVAGGGGGDGGGGGAVTALPSSFGATVYGYDGQNAKRVKVDTDGRLEIAGGGGGGGGGGAVTASQATFNATVYGKDGNTLLPLKTDATGRLEVVGGGGGGGAAVTATDATFKATVYGSDGSALLPLKTDATGRLEVSGGSGGSGVGGNVTASASTFSATMHGAEDELVSRPLHVDVDGIIGTTIHGTYRTTPGNDLRLSLRVDEFGRTEIRSHLWRSIMNFLTRRAYRLRHTVWIWLASTCRWRRRQSTPCL